MKGRQVGRVNQKSQGEIPLESGVLQRAAVRAVADKEGEATEDVESGMLRESRFVHDFSQGKIGKEGKLMDVAQTPNQTGLPDDLKAGVENLSGYSFDNVKVYYNSPKPAQLKALAYTQGTEIHVAAGQEKHLPHEVWHVVQQKEGRVRPTLKIKDDVSINNEMSLEREADVKGRMVANADSAQLTSVHSQVLDARMIPVVQRLHEPLQLADVGKTYLIKLGKETVTGVLVALGRDGMHDFDPEGGAEHGDPIRVHYLNIEKEVTRPDPAAMQESGSSSHREPDDEEMLDADMIPERAETQSSVRATSSEGSQEIVQPRRGERRREVGVELYGTKITKYQREMDKRIAEVLLGGAYVPYEMNGAQSALTVAEGKSYATTDQMHSEMVALNAQLANPGGKYEMRKGQVIAKDTQASVGGDRYSTALPHCGFCTFFLRLLGLPTTKPTVGGHLMASNANYPLPPLVRADQEVMRKLLGADLTEQLVRSATTSGRLEWDDFDTKGYLDVVWHHIQTRLNDQLKDLRKKK